MFRVFWLPVGVVLAALVTGACGNGSSMRNPAVPTTVGQTSIVGAPSGGDVPGTTPGTNGPGPGMGSGGGMTGPGMGGGGSMLVGSEFDYLTHMIPHHEEAIDSAQLLLRGTNRPEMRTFASTIISSQSSEVRQMRIWLDQWYRGRDITVSDQPMMRDLGGLTGDALDRAFLEDMIPHHMMAVMLSQQLLMRRLAVHREVVPFATAIRDTQQAEIHRMRGWLYEWFGN